MKRLPKPGEYVKIANSENMLVSDALSIGEFKEAVELLKGKTVVVLQSGSSDDKILCEWNKTDEFTKLERVYITVSVEDLEEIDGQPTRRIYISGPITGIYEGNKSVFEAAERDLSNQGYEVVNPHKLDHSRAEKMQLEFDEEQSNGLSLEQMKEKVDKIHAEYMRTDIKALCECSHMALLPGFANSKGAKMEIEVAKMIKIDIIYAFTLEPANL